MDVVFPIILLLIVGALVLQAAYIRRKRLDEERRQGPQYVWVAVIGPSNAESSEGAYKAAYLLLQADIRMRLAMTETYVERGFISGSGTMKVVERVAYSTETFRPHRSAIRSMDDFSRYAPYRADRLMHLSVHPEDADNAARLLREAGLTVELPPGKHWWH